MVIHNNFYNDITMLIIYEFIYHTHPIWFQLIVKLINNLMYRRKKIFYINNNINFIELKPVAITVGNILMFIGLINVRYYNIKFTYLNKTIFIEGNQHHVIVNYNFYNMIKEDNIYKSELVKMYELPIKKYDKQECLVCFNNEGILVGLCGHQNICGDCLENLDKCPMCNSSYIIKKSSLLKTEIL